jgi:DNA mismatch endonuclease, patch repair protein
MLMGASQSRGTTSLRRARHKRANMQKKSTIVSTRITPPDETRSRTMRAVRSFGNRSTELRMVALLRQARITGWRRHLPLPGRPDFAWPAARVALFVDGCFWHGCPYCRPPMPKTNAAYWVAKVAKNVGRDRRVRRLLRTQGWSVLRVWEHSLANPGRVAQRITAAIRGRASEK